MVTPEIIDRCIEIKGASTEQWPDGMDVQVISPAILEVGDLEHVVPLNHELPQLPNPAGNQRHIRMTLDTFDDGELRVIVMPAIALCSTAKRLVSYAIDCGNFD